MVKYSFKLSKESLTIFFISNDNFRETIVNKIISEGFYILTKKLFTLPEIRNCQYIASQIEKLGLFNNDNQILIVVAFDIFPIPVKDCHKNNYLSLDNARLLIKNKVWDHKNNFVNFNKNIPKFYFTYNSNESERLLTYFFSDEINIIGKKIDKFKDLLSSNYPVLKKLANGRERRARVELIDYKGTLAVKKTYRPGCDRFWERERFVMEELSQIRSEIPPLLEQGTLYLIYPYYEDIFKFDRINNPKISLEIATQAMEILYFFYDLGYALIDFYPNNLIVDKKEGLKIIDFEFLYKYKYKHKPDSFMKCYDLAGIPEDFDGDRPVFGIKTGLTRSYKNDWQPYIGLELNELLKQIPCRLG